MGKVAAGLFAHSEGLSRRPYVEELLLGGKKSLAWLLEGMRHIVDHVVVISPSEDRLELIEKILAEEGHSEFEGIIDAIDGNIWTMTIEGETRTVDVSEAEIKGEPAVGLQAEVEGTVVDNTIMASEVEIKEPEEG